MDWEKNIDLSFDDVFKKKKIKSKTKAKKFDFSSSKTTKELMNFAVLKSMNFELPQKNESIFFLTMKQFGLVDVLDYIIKIKKKYPDEILIHLFSSNRKASAYLVDLAKKTDMTVLISSLRNVKTAKDKFLYSMIESVGGAKVFYARTHAKLIAFKIDNDYFVITGSLNVGSSSNIETMQIFNSEDFYNFVIKSSNDIINKLKK